MSFGDLPCPEHPGKSFKECEVLHDDPRFPKAEVTTVTPEELAKRCKHLLREEWQLPDVIEDPKRGPRLTRFWQCPDCDEQWTTSVPHRD